MTDRELMQQALKAMGTVGADWICEASHHAKKDQHKLGEPCPLQQRWHIAYQALRERLAQPEQEFTTHEEGEDGWSDWVCPDPQSYLMKCCDCGLVHEAQFGVVRYKSEAEREDCEKVDDPNLQAVFRMRRSEEWTPDDTAYRPGGLAQPEQYEQAVTDALVGGTGVVLGGERIDPASIYKQPEQEQEPVAWRDHVEQRLLTWRQSFVNRSGDQLALEDFMDKESLDDLIDYVCDEYTTPPRREWVGLTDQEIDPITQAQWGWNAHGLHDAYRAYVRAIEAKLKEKNA